MVLMKFGREFRWGRTFSQIAKTEELVVRTDLRTSFGKGAALAIASGGFTALTVPLISFPQSLVT